MDSLYRHCRTRSRSALASVCLVGIIVWADRLCDGQNCMWWLAPGEWVMAGQRNDGKGRGLQSAPKCHWECVCPKVVKYHLRTHRNNVHIFSETELRRPKMHAFVHWQLNVFLQTLKIANVSLGKIQESTLFQWHLYNSVGWKQSIGLKKKQRKEKKKHAHF